MMTKIPNHVLTVALTLAISAVCISDIALAGASYVVTINTSDQSGAGTDSNICLKLYGTRGHTDLIKINRLLDGNAFESGDRDTFVFTASDVGSIIKIEVKSDGSGIGSDWHLKEISVRYHSRAANEALKKSSTDGALAIVAKMGELAERGGIITSTFPYNAWVTGEERFIYHGKEHAGFVILAR
ncbi:PLAT/LH2 domain protein [Polystyrenella longa]|uniref:PLAT/LH2 domain protein n=1 Tax=Polystyrenella longa TaxID=2528007 RepID=A0A518CKR7_9PLAN|nr:PLAT/LH2 domain-containing protein [Polystyrenella longa]QDU79816.1 PLAT/LH2 domain protein [Polystyrenella longa]